MYQKEKYTSDYQLNKYIFTVFEVVLFGLSVVVSFFSIMLFIFGATQRTVTRDGCLISMALESK